MKLQVQIKQVLDPKENQILFQSNKQIHTVAFRIAVRISNVVKVSNGLIDSRARANVS
jgi:hypothetical protein